MYNDRVGGRWIAKPDVRSQPAYPITEAARYLKLPSATLRTWVLGRPYPTQVGSAQFRPVIRAASAAPVLLSFWNLIEAHVLRALRTEHGVSLRAFRQAVAFAERELGIDRLLLRQDLRSNAGRLFLDRYGELINLSASGQLAMRQVLEAHLMRVRWDKEDLPIRLHPFVASTTASNEMPIAIDAAIAFGRPVILRRGISTAAIVARIDAGEDPAEIARDYDLEPGEVEEAVVYERAA